MIRLLVLLLLSAPLGAVEQLVIGSGGMAFLDARESSTRLSVGIDSIWIWFAAVSARNVASYTLLQILVSEPDSPLSQ